MAVKVDSLNIKEDFKSIRKNWVRHNFVTFNDIVRHKRNNNNIIKIRLFRDGIWGVGEESLLSFPCVQAYVRHKSQKTL